MGAPTYETKDSGVRAEFASGMVRDTEAGKARFDLLFPLGIPYGQQILTRFAELMERGAVKYEERNWEKADGKVEYDRMKRSALRHMIQWFVGETDEDHAAAVMFNIMAAETTKVKMQQPDLGCSTLPDGSCVASDCRLHASPLPEDACPCYAPGDMDCFASDCQSGGPRPCPNCMPGLCKTCDGAASR